VQEILRSYSMALEEATDVILKEETLSGDDIINIISRFPPKKEPVLKSMEAVDNLTF
jgi:ATP-dependent Zn protease